MARSGQSETGNYRVEVIADSSGKWAGNGLRFDTEENAYNYGQDLWSRWTAVRSLRVAQVSDGSVVKEWTP